MSQKRGSDSGSASHRLSGGISDRVDLTEPLGGKMFRDLTEIPLMRETWMLIGVLIPLFGGGAYVWSQVLGVQSLPAFLLPAGICLTFGAVALWMQERAMRRGSDLAGSIGSIPLRTLGPMLSATVIAYLSPELVKQRLFPAFVACYLLTLIVETILSVCLINRWEQKRTNRES